MSSAGPTIDDRQDTSGESARHWSQLSVQWDERSRLCAEWLRDAECVADLGCGLMTLERYLPNSTRYIPLDLVSRDSRTIIVDLNRELIPKLGCDAFAMLGVLEYIDNVPRILTQLGQFKRTVFNYNHFSINDVLWKLKLREKRVTWVNRYAASEIQRLVMAAGLKIVRRRKVRIGEILYEVSPVSIADESGRTRSSF